MDSPVIMDTASKFGQNLDPGFPFDDQGFGRLGDIRSQLDNLATRHPEFAEHLLGPPWGDVPLHGTLRNRRRGSTSGNSHQGHPDEDTRSQASGSSAASAASGASGISSHGEPEQHIYQHQEMSNKIPQYGLRNTVDIGQHHHNMDNDEKLNREQRSASAPPENRQQIQDELLNQQQHQQPMQGNQRFISRVDITPQFNQQTDDKGSMPKLQQYQESTTSQQHHHHHQKPQQQQANVRHIPIFVEGRDEPIIPKNIDESKTSTRQQSPLGFHSRQFDEAPFKFHSQPHFQRPSAFNQHFGSRHRDWSPHFQDSFHDVFDHPGVYKSSQPTPFRQSRQQHQQPQSSYQQQNERPSSQAASPEMGQSQSSSSVPPEQSEIPQEPKRKIFIPKDPLEKVDDIQKEVDSLTEQIKLWNGNTKTDKQYIYLDEMLTRELIKLDDVETEGKENVRQARKNVIKSIQNSISLLESKVTSPQPMNESQLIDEHVIDEEEIKEKETAPEPVASIQENNVVIPLPVASPSPTKDMEECNTVPENQTPPEPTNDQTMQLNESQNLQVEIIPVVKNSTVEVEQNKSVETDDPKSMQEDNNQYQCEPTKMAEQEQNVTPKSGKSPKKLRKTKKQPPISTEAIPLPNTENYYSDENKKETMNTILGTLMGSR